MLVRVVRTQNPQIGHTYYISEAGPIGNLRTEQPGLRENEKCGIAAHWLTES